MEYVAATTKFDFTKLWGLFNSDEGVNNIILTVIIFMILSVVRFFLLRLIREAKSLKVDSKRKWIRSIKNFSLVTLLFFITLIWAKEMQTFAISILALGVTGVLAFKELIVCILGGIIIKVSKPFELGDRIEVDNYKGDVIDYSLLTTHVVEVGPVIELNQYTGKTIEIPNSVFVTKPVFNHSLGVDYTLHTITFSISNDLRWKEAVKSLEEIAYNECKNYIADAQIHLRKHSLKLDILDIPNVEPRVSIMVESPLVLKLYLRIPCPNLKQGTYQQTITRKFLSYYHSIPTNNASFLAE